MLKKRTEKFIKNPKRGLFILALPILIGMLVQTLYNIVDTAFVGRLGAESIAALTFAFPVFFIFISINAGLGAGVGSRISRFLGELKKQDAENTAIHGLIISLTLAAIIFILGITFVRPLFELLGAQNEVLKLSIDYMSIIFIGIFFFFLVSIFNAILTAQGDSKTAMKIMISALIVNVLLDPIFIYVLGYGVKGAAIATTIAFFIGFLISIYYIKKKSILEIRVRSFKFSKKITKEIFYVGLPATLMMLTMSIAIIFINKFMMHFGVNYIAAFGISSRLESLIIMPIVAISMSMMTLVGMIYGAKKYDLLKQTSNYGLKIGVLIAITMSIILFLFPNLFLRIFTSDKTLLNLASSYLRIVVFAYPLIAITVITGRIMQGLGLGLPGFIINLIRTLIIYIPLAYFFIFVLEKSYLSIPVASIISSFVSMFVAIIWLKIKLDKLHIEII